LHFPINQASVLVGVPHRANTRKEKKETINATSPFNYIARCSLIYVDFETFLKPAE